MSFDYEIGQVPRGWERGDPIGVVNENFRFGRTIALERKRLSYPPNVPICEVSLRFDVQQAGKVLAWLRWWFEDFPNDYLDIERKIR